MKKINQSKFIVRNSDKLIIIAYHDLLFCVADSAYSKIHSITHGTVHISKTLVSLHQILDAPFIIRISQSVLVNIYHVKHIIYKEKIIELITGEKLRYTISVKEIEKMISDGYLS